MNKEGVLHDTRYENPRLERNGISESYTNGEYGPDLLVDFLPTICDLASLDVATNSDGQSLLPQLLRKTGEPRKYVYSWYSKNGKNKTARVFSRTHRYKLYRSGNFIDVLNDVKEKSPLSIDSLNPEQIRIKATLKGVIDKYDNTHRR